jgi:hypothetical protein
VGSYDIFVARRANFIDDRGPRRRIVRLGRLALKPGKAPD